MTERGKVALDRGPHHLQIGPSRIERDGDALTIRIDERTVPWPSRIRGEIRLQTPSWAAHPVALDGAGKHRWQALAPCAQVQVMLEAPARCWSGRAYLDHNEGDAALADAFRRWDWSRAHLRDGSTAVCYDVLRRDGTTAAWALRFDPDGAARDVVAPAAAVLPSTAWGLDLCGRGDGGRARLERRFESGPFYARSLLSADWFGEPVQAVHERVSLQRFEARWVQALLPFRMPRRSRWSR